MKQEARTRFPPTYQAKFKMVKKGRREAKRRSSDEVGSVCSTKEMDPKSTKQVNKDAEVSQSGSAVAVQDVAKKASPKCQLQEICSSERWRPPKYECCKEEGPGHMKSFTFKVVVEVQKLEVMQLECYGGPQPTKKKAAEHAAESALWYLRQTGNKLDANK